MRSGCSPSISINRALLIDILTQQTTFVDQITAGNIVLEGDAEALLNVFGNIDTNAPGFAIVEP
ncbi:hypothetical protein GM51_19770 [freshwater metagenome]|uniref:Alkyl sulfatase C-terminal domain-containing protein n=1 Tax=freshwater metagenome TaxID=449393 RepID=A0A094QGH6_9ZZZZ